MWRSSSKTRALDQHHCLNAKYGKNYFSQQGGSPLAKVTVDFRWEK
jgi:hypothetical protein